MLRLCNNTQVGIIQGSLSVSCNYMDRSQRVKGKLLMVKDKQYRSMVYSLSLEHTHNNPID